MKGLRFLLVLSSCFAGAAPVLGQGAAVIPPGAATRDGNSIDREPFGYDRVRHVQYVHRSLLGSVPTGRNLRAIAYRRDASYARTATLRRVGRGAKVKPVWTVQLGNVPMTANVQNPPVTFPRQGQSGFTVVINGRTMDFPDLPPPPASGPAPWTIKFPFDRPFVYQGAHLAVDHFVYESVNQGYSYYVDAVESSPGSGGRAGLISPTSLGCPRGQNRARGLAPNPGAGDLEFFLFGAVPRNRVFACLGAGTQSWGGLKLPYDLGAFGLVGCKIYTDWSVVVPTRATSAGTAEFRTPVPAMTTLLGASLFGQWVAVDHRVNPSFPFASSDGIRFTLGKQLGGESYNTSVVSGTGNVARGRVGYVQPGRGPVFQLSW